MLRLSLRLRFLLGHRWEEEEEEEEGKKAAQGASTGHTFPKWRTLSQASRTPTNNAKLNKLPPELQCRKIFDNHRLSMQIGAKRAKTCMQCVYVPTELPFLGWDRLLNSFE